MLNTQRFLITLQPWGRSTRSYTWCLRNASSSWSQAVLHSSSSAFGSLEMSWYFHSLGDFSIGVGETTLEMRKVWNFTPPSWHSLARASFSGSSDEGSSDLSTSSPSSFWSSPELEEVLSGEGLLSGGGELGPETGSDSCILLDHSFLPTNLLQSLFFLISFSIWVGCLSPYTFPGLLGTLACRLGLLVSIVSVGSWGASGEGDYEGSSCLGAFGLSWFSRALSFPLLFLGGAEICLDGQRGLSLSSSSLSSWWGHWQSLPPLQGHGLGLGTGFCSLVFRQTPPLVGHLEKNTSSKVACAAEKITLLGLCMNIYPLPPGCVPG